MRRYLIPFVLILTACGGSDGPVEPPPPVSLAVSMSAELYQTLDNGDCDFDVTITATGDGTATWTGLGYVWHIDGDAYADSFDAAFVTEMFESASIRAGESVWGPVVILPDSVALTLRYTVGSRPDSLAVMLRCVD